MPSSHDYWNRKACLITGGSAGLGRVLAETLVRRGARVIINGRNPERLAAAVTELKQLGGEVTGAVGDIAAVGFAQQLVTDTVDSLQGLDFVCHAAGRSMRGELASTSREDFKSLWRVNTLAAFELARAAVEPLTTTRGHLVLIGSLASRVSPRLIGAYAESKFPLTAMAQQLRLERGPAGLHTLLVCPGPIARTEQTPSDRYEAAEQGLPEAASKPGGGAKVSALDPQKLCDRILQACESRQAELIMPGRARLLFVLNQLSPKLGDWLLRKMSG
ncbi:SDR family NAD(P)-dependent oxidoreductase [Aeoliella sp. ICT_H6.2]|uniref:SDR family NAD(P)-dependent oxidoreductase n=1 Tax=Aeoliella straminimaris TaxID=2954799 RepID=A0A9X2F743_9BACT|nr:SDR family NAD(P)-dependent oxidoreductase [Aeoliella straminimaris]MCO6043505.1 SDR family NAD(P)-dependent oxidoreductase [Aeoliella straminimaris]